MPDEPRREIEERIVGILGTWSRPAQALLYRLLYNAGWNLDTAKMELQKAGWWHT